MSLIASQFQLGHWIIISNKMMPFYQAFLFLATSSTKKLHSNRGHSLKTSSHSFNRYITLNPQILRQFRFNKISYIQRKLLQEIPDQRSNKWTRNTVRIPMWIPRQISRPPFPRNCFHEEEEIQRMEKRRRNCEILT